MFLLVLSDAAADIHSGAEDVENVLVNDVDLGTELIDVLLVFRAVRIALTDNEMRDELAEILRGQLLLGVAQGAGRVAVGLQHKAVKTEVKSPLGNLLEIFAVSSHVARIGEERHIGETGPELDGNLPARGIAVSHLVRCRESPVNYTEFPDAGLVEPFESSDPQIEVRVDRVLHKHRDIRILQCISDFLYKERIGGGAGSNPDHIHAELQAVEYMLLAGNLGGHLHSEFILDPLKPFEARCSYTLEIVRMSARLPDTCSEDIDAQGLETAGSLHYLNLRLGAARACYHQRFLSLRENAPFGNGDEIESAFHIELS